MEWEYHRQEIRQEQKLFLSGNRVSLETRPKDQGVSVREGLLAFHNEWYSRYVGIVE